MAFTNCCDQGSDLLPPDGRASTLTTQSIQPACHIIKLGNLKLLFPILDMHGKYYNFVFVIVKKITAGELNMSEVTRVGRYN